MFQRSTQSPEEVQLKGFLGSWRDTQTVPFSAGETWERFLGWVRVTRQFQRGNCAMGRIRRASGGGKKWGGFYRAICLFVCLFNHTPSPLEETVRLERAARTAGFLMPPKLGPESLASLQGPVGAVPVLGQSATTRFPGLSEGPRADRGRRASGNRGPRRRGGRPTRQIDRSWELRARTFRKRAGASSRASPPPPARTFGW